MAFAKIDTRILDSSLWVDRGIRDIFLTALLMGLPYEVTEPMPQLKVDSLEETGFIVLPDWYGFVAAAGPGLIHRALLSEEEGMVALRALGEPDRESRSQEFEGRRLVRVNGGFIILNFMKFRDRDTTNAERQRQFRERQRRKAADAISPEAKRVTSEFSIIDRSLEKKIDQAIKAYSLISKKSAPEIAAQMIEAYKAYTNCNARGQLRFVWSPATFFSQSHWTSMDTWPIEKAPRGY